MQILASFPGNAFQLVDYEKQKAKILMEKNSLKLISWTIRKYLRIIFFGPQLAIEGKTIEKKPIEKKPKIMIRVRKYLRIIFFGPQLPVEGKTIEKKTKIMIRVREYLRIIFFGPQLAVEGKTIEKKPIEEKNPKKLRLPAKPFTVKEIYTAVAWGLLTLSCLFALIVY